jgi:hypothetical protein
LATRAGLLLVLALVLLIRLPFLNQAIQGDDPYYLYGARHALIDPAHPTHVQYVFQGAIVDMRGHPHPPLNSWMLAGLLLLFGNVSVVPFRSAYVLFSLMAAAATWTLARRWSPHPTLATFLFIATPAFLISGNTLETDLPFLAFWMTGFALFVSRRFLLAGVALFLAAMTSYQAVVATPILCVWCWLDARRSKNAWIVALTPVVAVGGYQLYERMTSGALPAAMLAGYFQTYGLQEIEDKLRNAAALTVHLGWLVFPLAAMAAFRNWPAIGAGAIAGAAGILIDPHPLFWLSFAAGVIILAGCLQRRDWLSAWILLFFAAALVLFFAGAARYLLPIAAPVAILVSNRLSRKWLVAAFAPQMALSLALAWSNLEHWNGYREFAQSLPDHPGKLWINGEWGLRFYLENRGGVPLALDDIVHPGDRIVASELGFPIPVKPPLQVEREFEIRPTLPLRVMGLEAKSGYATVAFGLRPFDITTHPADRVRTYVVEPRKVTLSWLPMGAPEADEQILGGIYGREGQNRWMGRRAVLLLVPPAEPRPLEIELYIPPAATAKHIRILVDGVEVHAQPLPREGIHHVRTKPIRGSTVAIEVDRTFKVGADQRPLGLILIGVGWPGDPRSAVPAE